jgi:hypothetical protein
MSPASIWSKKDGPAQLLVHYHAGTGKQACPLQARSRVYFEVEYLCPARGRIELFAPLGATFKLATGEVGDDVLVVQKDGLDVTAFMVRKMAPPKDNRHREVARPIA